MLVSSIVIEIKILLVDQILDHFLRHPVDKTCFTVHIPQDQDLNRKIIIRADITE
jgi:hypothetical protein